VKIINFIWKTRHDAYKVGKYWRHIPDCKTREACHVCQAEESMDHILTECSATGQKLIWELAETMWDERGLPWVWPSLGLILGNNLADFRSPCNTALTGANQFFTILISEFTYLIWKLRCEWRIEHGGNPDKIPEPEKIRRLWFQTLSRRLKLDCLMTNRSRYGSRAIQTSLVDKTWWIVLQNRSNLPSDWPKGGISGVLVGSGSACPPGRNR